MADNIHAAFAKAYAAMHNPVKNATNPAFNSRYTNLEGVLEVVRPALTAEGLSLVQEPVSDENGVGVRTRVLHAGGEIMDFGSYILPLQKVNAQGAGSAITYARRYAAAAIFGLAQEDDDGNSASAPAPAKQHSLRDRFDTLMTVADLKGNKDAVAEKLEHPKTKGAAIAAFTALSEDARKELEDIAENGVYSSEPIPF